MTDPISFEEKKALARSLYLADKSVGQIASETGIPKSSVATWCHDLIEAKRQRDGKRPVYSKEFIAQKKKEARELYLEDTPISTISTMIGMSVQAISRWLHDLTSVKNNAAKAERARIAALPKAPIIKGHQRLTDEVVLELRREVRDSGERGWRKYAERYRVSMSLISLAVRGDTFKHLNHIEPPVFTDSVGVATRPKTNKVHKKPKPDEKLLNEALTMRRSDPITWTYKALATWMAEKTNRKYQPNHISIALYNRDHTLRAFDESQPKSKKAYVPIKRTPEELEEMRLARIQRKEDRKQEREARKAKVKADRLALIAQNAKKRAAEKESLRTFMAAERQRDRDIARLERQQKKAA